MEIELVEPGQHFWATDGDEIVLICRSDQGEFFCPGFDVPLTEWDLKDFSVVKIVDYPDGFGSEDWAGV